jgi:hypothetical protein
MTWAGLLTGIWNYGAFFMGYLQYEHFKFGRLINYTYDNRSVFIVNNSWLYYDWVRYPFNLALAPGTWSFVFTSDVFDLKKEDQSTYISVWMNFSKDCNDINISSNEGGTVYGLWYGEFDANVIQSKAWTSELLINGKTRFHINNTFIYQFLSYPFNRGYWNVRWNTPQGAMVFHALFTKNKRYFDENKTEGSLYGIGGPGNYKLRIGSFDYNHEGGAWMPYFLGLDVKLS